MGIIVTKKEFKNEIRPEIKKENKTIALCHGVFDLVHPGHIIHLEQAKEMADILVVSITAAKYVRKGPGRPYFNDDMRLKVLAALECVDYVMLSEGYTVDDIVECVEPDFYVKGQEYADENADVTANIGPERELVERHGGRIRYTGGQVFSSTKLINKGLSALSNEVIDHVTNLKKRYSIDDIVQYADKARELKILVIGDIIIDRYTFCSVQGLMSKNMAYSARLQKIEDYLGGSAAVARHLSSFCSNVTLLSVTGNEPDIDKKFNVDECRNINLDLIQSQVFPTIIKQRYITPEEKREEYTKVFVINNIPPNPRIDDESHTKLVNKIKSTIHGYDAVFLCDFGHGLIDNEIMELVRQEAKFLVLNCQTNSSNYGLNNITKYRKADVFTLDQREQQLAYPEYLGDEEKAFRELFGHLNAKMGWLTRGSAGAWGLTKDEMDDCPAFTLSVSDTIGAGDAFYSIAGLFAVAGAPLEIGTMMGNVAGALGANIVGNKKSVERVDVLKFASTLMNV